MATTEEYLLRFDLDKFQAQIDDVRRTYTDFGRSLQGLISRTDEELVSLQEQAASVNVSLSSITPQMERSVQIMESGVGSTSNLLEEMSRHSEKIANDMTRLSGVKMGAATKDPTPPQLSAAEAKAEIVKESVRLASMSSDEVKHAALESIKKIQEADKASVMVINRAKRYLKSELDAAKGQVKSVLSHVPGGVMTAGGIAGGLLAAMVMGYQERDRLRWQSGEILNVFEATGEALSSKASKRATRFFSGFQETAQWFYGVAKEETQAVLKSMVDAGYRSKDFMTTYNKDLGLVGKNVTVASIAVDKHFNQKTGTSMSNIIKITTELGDSLDTATDKYVKLAFAGQRSAMGIGRFVDSVISGSSAMQQYGVDVSNVASVMETIRKHYEDMGLDPRYAGNQASQVIGGMSAGLANLNPSMKAVLAQQMFPELNALDALQKWEDGFLRVAEGGGDDFMQKALVLFTQWSSRGGRSRAQSIRVMEYQGMDNRTAATLYDLGEKLARTNDLSELSKDETKHLRRAFMTESQRVSSLHKTQRRLYRAIGEIGRGLIKVLVGLLGVIVTGIRALPDIVSAAVSGSPGQVQTELSRISDQLDTLNAHMGTGVDQIMKGAGMVPGILGKEFGRDFKPLLDALNYKVPTGGGMRPITSLEDADAAAKELGSVFSDLAGDEDFRRQVKDQMTVDFLKNAAWASEMMKLMHAPEEGEAPSEDFQKWSRRTQALEEKASAVEGHLKKK